MSSARSKGSALMTQDSHDTHIQTRGTYKALEVSAPGVLRIVQQPVSEPGAGQVRIRVEACGICAGDIKAFVGAESF